MTYCRGGSTSSTAKFAVYLCAVIVVMALLYVATATDWLK